MEFPEGEEEGSSPIDFSAETLQARRHRYNMSKTTVYIENSWDAIKNQLELIKKQI